MALEDYTFFIDHLGILVWIFLIYISVSDLRNKITPKWTRLIVLGIGIIGIFLDGSLLFLGYVGSELDKIAPFFDHFGIPVFLFLFFIGLKDLKNINIKRPYWTKIVLLLLAVGGLIADSFILLKYYGLIN